MRGFVSAGVVACASLSGGCAYFPDFGATNLVHHVPISEVVNQIRCDMHRFLRSAPDDANFSLDKKSYATVELALATTGTGDVKFSRIDTVRLGATGFLAIGSSSQPFPSLGVKQVSQNVAKVQVNISQDPKLLEHACSYGRGEILSSAQHADRVLINDMRIAEWLKRSFERGEGIKREGATCNTRSKKGGDAGVPCSVSLELATLTAKFQLAGDVSGGVLDLAKLVPVVVTPTLQLSRDYYHQITIIFSGNNAVAEGRRRFAKDDTPFIFYRDSRRTPRYEEESETPPPKSDDVSPEAEAYRRKELERLRKREKELMRRLERLERERDAIRDAERETDSILRQLRSIRDATILNAPR